MSFDRIAGFALETRDVPQCALDMDATLLIDSVGVAAAAAGMEAGRSARNHALAFHDAGAPEFAAHMMFNGHSTSIPGAVFAAGTQIDNLDTHDGLNPTKGHIDCVVVPALFVLAEARPELSARDALSALVMSYEIAARAALALHATVNDYHTSGAWNALGVTSLWRMRERLMQPETEFSELAQLVHAPVEENHV